MQQLLLKVTNCEGILVKVSASVYTVEFPSKLAGPAFSGPVFKNFWYIFSCVLSLCMVICDMMTLGTGVCMLMKPDFHLSPISD